MFSRFTRLVFLGIIVQTYLVTADEDQGSLGLQAVVSGPTHSVRRIDNRISFNWHDAPLDDRLTDGTTAVWTGNILVRQPGRHTFHANVSGRVTLIIDGNTLLDATGENLFHSGQPTELGVGDHRLEVQFSRERAADAKLQLYWSSPDFTLEPLSADTLSFEASDQTVAIADSGRYRVDALRCGACHQGIGEMPTLKAPSLERVNELTQQEIATQLMNPHSANPDSMMPSFGFSQTEAADVAAFLHSVARKDRELWSSVTFQNADAEAGSKLLLTTGCVACHRLSQLKDVAVKGSNPYHGPDLTRVAERRSASWLLQWLQAPAALNADHRMPIFSLTPDEQRQLVAALQEGVKEIKTDPEVAAEPSNTADEKSIATGRELVVSAGCVSCHQIPSMEAAKPVLPRPGKAGTYDKVSSCVAHGNEARHSKDHRRQPRFFLSDRDANEVEAWFQTLTADLQTATHTSKATFLLNRNGCLICHDRDQSRGLSGIAGEIESKRDDLRGQSQALIPPALTAVGDRLRDDYLLSAVAGEQESRRLPWLLVRMPRFAFKTDDRKTLADNFIGSDRIPDSADAARPELFEHLNPHHPSLATASELLIGNQLTGAGGFNCVSCHKAGPFEPRNVAMGTRGSDIMTMGQRLRSRYFMRWMQNPIRVIPGIEMPALRKPIPSVLEDSLSQQIAMLWKSLADPKFSPPTVVSRYEQFVTVSPGSRPRVIRDVFTIGNTRERNSVARAFAVGFGNGHNVLLDLDTMHVRQWSIGEFARQRTEGKSWFWDMAGVSVRIPRVDGPAVRLKNLAIPESEGLIPVVDERRQAELLSYRVDQQGVSLRVRFYFADRPGKENVPDTSAGLDRSPHSAITAWNDPSRELLQVIVQFSLQAEASAEASGWRMTALVEECPDGRALQLESWQTTDVSGDIPWTARIDGSATEMVNGQTAQLFMQTELVPPAMSPPLLPGSTSLSDRLTSVPGFEGQRLPIETGIMPTAMTWLDDGRMGFVSLRGQVWIARDTDKDGVQDTLTLFADGLAAPYGLQADGDALLVAHKPEVLRLRDSDGDGTADQFDVVAAGWGLSDDYHDWTTGLIRNRSGDLFVGLGSDYSQNNRPIDNDRWRGTVLKIDSTGTITPVAYSMRFPMGLALDRDEHLFATDNQGVQNTFNEINHVIPERHYGVPSRHENAKVLVPETPSLMIPHPWTRSVNSLAFFPDDYAVPELAGHGIGCEYDTRCLIRFTIQNVDGALQGACYRFSLPDQPGGGGNFVGPVSSLMAPDGALYIGSIWDSGWQGGTNTGAIERLVPSSQVPNGIREIRATAKGFEVSFFHLVDVSKARDVNNWSLQGYTREWGGSYATPDSDRHSLTPLAIAVAEDGKTVSLYVDALKSGYVYEISVRKPLDGSSGEAFWPSEGHYSMKVVPK